MREKRWNRYAATRGRLPQTDGMTPAKHLAFLSDAGDCASAGEGAQRDEPPGHSPPLALSHPNTTAPPSINAKPAAACTAGRFPAIVYELISYLLRQRSMNLPLTSLPEHLFFHPTPPVYTVEMGLERLGFTRRAPSIED